MHDIPLVAHFSGANYISYDMSNPHFTSLEERLFEWASLNL